jgi:hypothetical protein
MFPMEPICVLDMLLSSSGPKCRGFFRGESRHGAAASEIAARVVIHA